MLKTFIKRENFIEADNSEPSTKLALEIESDYV